MRATCYVRSPGTANLPVRRWGVAHPQGERAGSTDQPPAVRFADRVVGTLTIPESRGVEQRQCDALLVPGKHQPVGVHVKGGKMLVRTPSGVLEWVGCRPQ